MIAPVTSRCLHRYLFIYHNLDQQKSFSTSINYYISVPHQNRQILNLPKTTLRSQDIWKTVKCKFFNLLSNLKDLCFQFYYKIIWYIQIKLLNVTKTWFEGVCVGDRENLEGIGAELGCPFYGQDGFEQYCQSDVVFSNYLAYEVCSECNHCFDGIHNFQKRIH